MQWLAIKSHNLKVEGSNPSSATIGIINMQEISFKMKLIISFSGESYNSSTQLYNMNLAGSFNGRTGVFEAHNECSTHSPAAKKDSYSNCFIFLVKNRYRVLNIQRGSTMVSAIV